MDLQKAKQNGMEIYRLELNEKIRILFELLENYDNGRSKSFFCLALNLLELHDIKLVMEKIADEITPETPRKAMAETAVRLFNEMAAKRSLSLKLRK